MHELARSPQQIGAIIRRVREARKMTQTEMAAHLGVRQATLSNIETGSTDLKISTLLKILAMLDLELSIASRSKATSRDIEDIF